jgi:AraC-like DNA-binding protein/Flp pilus assembly protein TadD
MLFAFFLYLCKNNINGVFMRKTILFLTVISLSALLSCGGRHSSTSPTVAMSDSALNALYNRAIADSTSFDTLCAIQQRGIEYSIASGNARREYLFRALKTIYYAIHREQDKYVTEARSLIDYYKTTDDEEHLYQAWFTLANNQLGWGDYNDAVDEAGKMSKYAQKTGSKQGKASSTLAFAECYEDNGQMKEAEKYYREAWELFPEVDDLGHTISTGFNLISICLANKRTAEAMSFSDQLPALIAKWEKKHDLLNPVYRMKYFLYRLNIYYDKKDRRMVTMLDDSVTYYNNMYADANQKVPVLYTHFRTCKINGDNARAMVYMDSVIQIKKQEGDNASLAGMYREKAELQNEGGDYQGACLSYDSFAQANDSAQTATSIRQLNRLTKQMKLDELKMQAVRSEMTAWIVGTAALLTIIICVILIVYARKTRRKNIALVEEITENSRRMQQMEKLLKERDAIAGATDENEPKAEDSLFGRIEAMMHDDEMYKQSKLTAQDMAAHLATNRNKINEAIQEGCGMSFGEYLTEVRLQQAIILMGQRADVQLSEVGQTVGYDTYSTFFRAFSKRFDISPSSFVTLANKRK